MVGRLCEPIEGLDSAHLAEWLGLDPSSYVQRGGGGGGGGGRGEEEEEVDVILPQEKSDPLCVSCPTCNKTVSFHYTGKKVK